MQRVKRISLITVGGVSLILGSLGVVIPLLPTTPFLLLSLACFSKSSTRLYNFIMNNKYLAPYVKDYMEGRGIPKHVKIKAIAAKWFGMGFVIIVVVDDIILRIMLLTIASLVSVYIYTRETPEGNPA